MNISINKMHDDLLSRHPLVVFPARLELPTARRSLQQIDPDRWWISDLVESRDDYRDATLREDAPTVLEKVRTINGDRWGAV